MLSRSVFSFSSVRGIGWGLAASRLNRLKNFWSSSPFLSLSIASTIALFTLEQSVLRAYNLRFFLYVGGVLAVFAAVIALMLLLLLLLLYLLRSVLVWFVGVLCVACARVCVFDRLLVWCWGRWVTGGERCLQK